MNLYFGMFKFIKATFYNWTKKHFTLLLVMLLLTAGKISAQDLSTLIPDNTTDAVSQAEIDLFDDYYKNFKIPINNNKKSMTWSLSPFIHSLVFMYVFIGEPGTRQEPQ